MFTTAILLAVLTALALAIGTHMQHSALRRLKAAGHGAQPPLRRLIGSPRWLLGMTDIALTTVLNVVALALAPVAVIQPIGALSLVASVIISALTLGIRVSRGLVAGVALTGGAVALFVTTSAAHAHQTTASGAQVLGLSAILLACAAAGLLLARSGAGHLARVVGAGVTYGGVASGAHVLGAAVLRALGKNTNGEAAAGSAPALQSGAVPGWAVLLALLVALAAAAATGMWLVQTAYASGPPETVLAGLTVIDPFTAVGVGAFILGEYSQMSPGAVALLVCSGAAALTGIALLAHYVPDHDRKPAVADEPAAATRSAEQASRRAELTPQPAAITTWENAK